MGEFVKQSGSFFGQIFRDEGVQRAIAGVAVAAVVAGAKVLIFGTGEEEKAS